MKRAIALIFVLAFSMCLFACGDTGDVPDGMFLASKADDIDYKLFVPEGWVVAQATSTTTQAYASNSDRTNVLVNQWNVTENTTNVDDWWKNEYKPQVFKAEAVKNPEIEKNSKGEEGVNATIGGKAGKKYVYTGMVGDTTFLYEVYACVANGSIYVIHVTYMEDGDPEAEELSFSAQESRKTEIEAIIGNFRFV